MVPIGLTGNKRVVATYGSCVLKCLIGAISLLTQKLLDRSGLIDTSTSKTRVKITEMFDRISVSIQKGGVPIAKRFMAWKTVIRKADILSANIEASVLPGDDDKRELRPD